MQFVEALSVLSKSSSFAVSTESDRDEGLSVIKSDLYVAMPIEEDFNGLLEEIEINSKKVIFLCGSSGDGKSELLLRAKQKYDVPYIRFHLDATHSFAPHDSAIKTLNTLFDEFKNNNYSLVIGINIGMLGNYAEEADCGELRGVLKKYLETQETTDNFNFINFENYPKFEITKDGYNSEFLTRIVQRVTSSTSEIHKLFAKDEGDGLIGPDYLKFVNYKMLCHEDIQKVIVELLLKIRLFRNAFVTARTFLDLIYELITRKDYLFNNLFNCIDNEILEKAIDFDPSRLRTKIIDRFILSYELNSLSEEFYLFSEQLLSSFMIKKLDSPTSYIRLFYILKYMNFGNNFHKSFEVDFSEEILLNYLNVYRNHRFYDESRSKKVLKSFYTKDVFSALRSYINKKAPYLKDDQFLIEVYGSCQVISSLKLSPDFLKIESSKQSKGSGSFDVHIKIKGLPDDELDPRYSFSIDINLYELLNRLKSGYRPSKNDRSVVVILNEIVNRLLNYANKSSAINFKTESCEVKFILEDDDSIEIED